MKKKTTSKSRQKNDGARPRQALVNQALWAQYALLIYNTLEAGLSIALGATGGSIALLSFGLNSSAELLSTGIVVWRLHKAGWVSASDEARSEARAFKMVGICLLAMALYVGLESINKLVAHQAPQPSLAGILIALAALVVMPWMSKYRHDLGHRIGSKALVADSRQTMLCVYSAVALLVGAGLNYGLGWWWADPAAGLFIAGLALYEGKRALEGKSCCY